MNVFEVSGNVGSKKAMCSGELSVLKPLTSQSNSTKKSENSVCKLRSPAHPSHNGSNCVTNGFSESLARDFEVFQTNVSCKIPYPSVRHTACLSVFLNSSHSLFRNPATMLLKCGFPRFRATFATPDSKDKDPISAASFPFLPAEQRLSI